MNKKRLLVSLIIIWILSALFKLFITLWFIDAIFWGIFIFGFYYLLLYIKNKKLWKVRNKLIFSGIFFIITPIILLTLFFLTVINVLIAQYGTRLFENLMNEQVIEIEKVSQYYLDNLKKGELQIQDFKSRLENLDLDFINFKILILKRNQGSEEILFCFPEELIKYQISSFSYKGYCKVDDVMHHGVFNIDSHYSILILFPLTKKYLNQISRINDFRIDFGGEFTKIDRGGKKERIGIPWEFSYRYLDFDDLLNGVPKEKAQKFYLYVNLNEIFKKLFSDRLIYSHSFVKKFFYLIIVVFGLIVLSSFFIGYQIVKRITKPINQLTHGMERVLKKDFIVKIETKDNDQIGYLAKSFNQMIDGFQKYVPKKDQTTKNLELTRDLQLELFPKDCFESDFIDLAASNIPSGRISNKFYDYYYHKNKRFTVYLFDILTEEISALLPMIYLKGMVSSYENKGENLTSLVKKSDFSVKQLLGNKKIDIKINCLRFNKDKKMGEYINIGEMGGLHYQKEKHIIQELIKKNEAIKKGNVGFIKGDIFFLFSKTLLEIRNKKSSILEVEDLKEIVLKNHGLSVMKIRQKIHDFILEFSENISSWDDINFIIIKVK